MSEPIIPDIQSSPDLRQIPIQRVGIRDLRMPLTFISSDGTKQSTIASVEMTVALPHDQKGTHMSRFIELMNDTQALSVSGLSELHQQMLRKLNAHEGTLLLSFPYFMNKAAPVTGVESLLDYDLTLSVDGGQTSVMFVEVTVPVTSLCPCSKEISKYGAHNQRSHIIMHVEYDSIDSINIEQLIRTAEQASSCEIWPTLKRVDEKYVTEKAYENPKFVEDIVRDIALRLNAETSILAYRISSENFESIHNHSAVALIEHDKRVATCSE